MNKEIYISFEFIEGPIPEQFISDTENSSDKGSGAIVSFRGCVRNDAIGDSEVQSIEFTAHNEIAQKEATEILKQSTKKHGLHSARIIHSLGKINAGNICFYVAVSSAHRRESFRAIEEIVDEFKQKVPVFGKEILVNGNYAWKENK